MHHLDRRAFLLSSGALAAAGIMPPALAQAAAAGGEDAKLRALLDQFFYDRIGDSPQQATSLGLDTGERAGLRSRLGDNSAAGEARQRARVHAEKKAMDGIDVPASALAAWNELVVGMLSVHDRFLALAMEDRRGRDGSVIWRVS